MPRQPDQFKKLDKKWNLYVNEIDKLDFILELTKAGHPQSQSAAVRAFMHLYANDKEVKDKINAIIDNFIVYKQDGNRSQL